MPESIRFDGSMAGLSSLVAVFLVLVTVTLALRFVARYKQKVKPGIDDYLAIVPWVRSSCSEETWTSVLMILNSYASASSLLWQSMVNFEKSSVEDYPLTVVAGMAKEFKGKLANPDKTLRPKPWETEKVSPKSQMSVDVPTNSGRLVV